MAVKSAVRRVGRNVRPLPAQALAARPALRSAERTRRAILAAATAEFAEDGLAGAGVDSIADVSRVNKRMLYYYFNSKEDPYLAVLEEAYTAVRASLSYFFFSNGPTLLMAFGKELRSLAARAARRAHVVDVILGYLRP